MEFRATQRYWPLLAQIMRAESHASLRQAIVTLAGRFYQREAPAHAILMAAAETDADPDIRTAASQYLSAM